MSSDVDGGASEYVTVTIAFATGAIAFSVGLIVSPLGVGSNERTALIIGTCIFGLAIVLFLVLKGMLIYNTATGVQAKALNQGRVVALFAIACIAGGAVIELAVLFFVSRSVPDTDDFRIQSPSIALSLAMVQVRKKPCSHVDGIPKVELIRGIEAASPKKAVWHVQINASMLRPKKLVKCPPAYDLFVDARSGLTTLY